MAFNGSGTFSLVAGNPVVTGTTISSTWANNTLSDIASNGLTNVIAKDGQTTPTANLTMGGFRLTNIAAGTAVSDAARVSQVQNGSFVNVTGVSGATTITGTLTPTPSAYIEGLRIGFVAVAANGASPTLNPSSLGAQTIFWNGATCTSSMWRNGDRIEVIYLATAASTASQTGFHVVGHTGFMPAGLLRVRGSVITGNGSGNVEVSSPSADDQVWVSSASASAGGSFKSIANTFGNVTKDFVFSGPSTASASAPAFRALNGAQAAMTLLYATSASATAQVDFTTGITSSFDAYVLVISDLVPATDSTQVNLRVSQDGGGTYKSGASDYAYTTSVVTDGTGSIANSTGTTVIAIAGGLSNAGVFGCLIRFYAPGGTARKKMFSWQSSYLPSGAVVTNNTGAGVFQLNTSAINAIRIFMSSGNITAGNFFLYGIRNV